MENMTNPEALLDIYKRAVYEKDIETFTSIFDEDLLVFDMWDKWNYKGLPSWCAMAVEWFAGLKEERDVITFSDISVQTMGNMSLLTFIARFAAVSAEGK